MTDAPLFPEAMGAILGDLLRPAALSEQPGPPWTHTFTAAPPHDDQFCADSNDWERCREDRRCIEGEVYGPCGHENCYGACEWEGTCRCGCHKVQATHTITKAA